MCVFRGIYSTWVLFGWDRSLDFKSNLTALMSKISGVRIYPTRDQKEADFVIRFCPFSECLGDDQNKTELFKITGTTRERQGTLEVLINTEMDLLDEIVLAKLTPSGNMDFHLNLKQVGNKTMDILTHIISGIVRGYQYYHLYPQSY